MTPVPLQLPDKRQLRLFMTLLVLAAMPLFMAIAAVVWIVGDQAQQLALAQIEAVKPIVLKARKDEIQHFVQAGRKVLAHFCQKNGKDPGAREEGRQLLKRMDFGLQADDNYFFIYAQDGTVVMHPRKPEIVGKNLWEHRDDEGTYVIQALLQQARTGGGYVDYVWHRPSTNRNEKKLGYAEWVPECEWMVGTGLYLDHVREAEEIIIAKTRLQVSNTRDKILLIALAALLLVAAGGLAVNLNEQRSANQKLRAMAQKVVQSQEVERTRVARELHDGVSQSLASVKFVLESSDIHLDRGDIPRASERLKEGVRQVIATMVDVRRISHNLYPTILDDEGLHSALHQLAREFGQRTGIAVEVFSSDGQVISREASRVLYRFTQQALGNVEAHAKASKVRITMRLDQGAALTIEDNGVGFDTAALFQQSRAGLGLTSMRERIEMLGGQFELESGLGGTRLTALLPMKALFV